MRDDLVRILFSLDRNSKDNELSSDIDPLINNSDDGDRKPVEKFARSPSKVRRKPRTSLEIEKGIARSDWFLRWTIVVLAFFLACTEISNTETLLRIKCGEFTASHFQPARVGIFSSTAETRPWANLSWLFDFILYGIYSGGSDIAISVFQASLVAGIVSLIVGFRISGVSTWWNVICAMLVVIACAPQWNALPEIVTFLGLGIILRFLLSWSETGSRKPLSMMLPVFMIWSNLDPRVYLGLILLLLFAMGELLGSLVDHPRAHRIKSQFPLWLAVAGSILACLINPFGWDSLIYPYRLYTVIDPAMTLYISEISSERDIFHFTMMNLSVWKISGWSFAASMFLIVIALISFILNRKKVRPGEWFSFIGFFGLALIAIRELPPAAFVACLLGLKCAQQWYLDSFRKTFSLKNSEQLFSRVGRFLTVTTMLVMGLLALGGHLGNDRHRKIGLGFSYEIEEAIAEFEEILSGSFDDRPFNFQRHQGDLLVWFNQKSFLDSRNGLYASKGGQNLLLAHSRIRSFISNSAASNNNRQVWQRLLQPYHVSHILAGTESRSIDFTSSFRTYLALVGSPDWQLVNLGATTAVFYRTDLDNPKLSQFRKARRIRFIETAFHPRQSSPDVGRNWNPHRSSFVRFLTRRIDRMTNETQLARHYFFQLQATDEGQFAHRRRNDMSLAFAYLTIRQADLGLARQSRDPVGFHILGSTYGYLNEIERRVGVLDTQYLANVSDNKKLLYRKSFESFSLRRIYQSVHSLRQSLESDPDYRPALHSLTRLFFESKKWDLAKIACTELLEESKQDRANGDIRKMFREINENIFLATSRVRQELKIATRTELSRPTPVEEAKIWYREGMILQAIQTLESASQRELDSKNAIEVSLKLAQLYLEAGWSNKTATILDNLEKKEQHGGNLDWRNLQAYVHLLNAEYTKAATSWRKNHLDTRQSQKKLPDRSFNCSFYLLQAALCSLEQGNMERATEEFRTILKLEPETPFKNLIDYYLILIQSP